jgi:hypothetical protein
MGRTLPSATVVFMQEEQAFARFRRALRRSDQLALDDLFVSARQHLAAAQYASHALPFEVFLLAMLLEEHKEVMQLRERVETLSTTRSVESPHGNVVLHEVAVADTPQEYPADTVDGGLSNGDPFRERCASPKRMMLQKPHQPGLD